VKVSLATAAALTGLSDRTLRRWIADGTLHRGDGARTMIELDELARHIRLDLDEDTRAIIQAADLGDADASNSLALLFLASHQPGRAAPWLALAADKGHADAMHWLARCHFQGLGAAQNGALGVMWLAKAAAHGHCISAQQLTALVRVPLAQT
jgi:hypothetical protein